MVKTKQHIGVDEPYIEGDSLVIDVPIEGVSQATRPIDVRWTLVDEWGGSVVLSNDDAGVSTTMGGADNDIATVSLDGGATDDLAGYYQHQLRLADADGRVITVARGEFEIQEQA